MERPASPPQLRELFRVVREQKLPTLVREKYAAARQSFASRPAEAAAAFDDDAAAMRRSIHPIYDRLLLNEARRWRYSAATRNGTPVRYRKVIEVVVGPR